MHPPVYVDLVTFVLRDVERVVIGVEPAVLGHGTAARPLADAPFGKGVQKRLDVVDQPTEVIETVAPAFSLIHVPTCPVRQDRHRRSAVGRPAHDAILRAYFLAGRRLAKAEDVDIKIQHVVVVRDTHGEMADARERAFDDGRVELMGGKSYRLAARIGYAVVAVEKAACFFTNVRL